MAGTIERARELMERSRRERFAVGAFNVDNQETLVAIARAAQVKSSPVLVEVSQGEVDAIGLANLRDMVDNYRAVCESLPIGPEQVLQLAENAVVGSWLHESRKTDLLRQIRDLA